MKLQRHTFTPISKTSQQEPRSTGTTEPDSARRLLREPPKRSSTTPPSPSRRVPTRSLLVPQSELVQEPKLLCFDFENMGGAYWFDGNMTSRITAMGWKWSHEEKAQSLLLTNDRYWQGNDGIRSPYGLGLIVFKGLLVQADVVYGHNIRKHDLPMFQAELLRQQLPPLPALKTVDTLRDLPKRGGMAASLENLVSMYGIEGSKFKMSQHDWEVANQLQPEGIALARKRVESDVILQEKLYYKLKELGLLRQPREWRP